ncbi:MAG: hypothetical protein WEE89_12855 [Gemmatimonadota bacterium]
MMPGVLRGLAIVIAAVAVIDPAITTARNSKPEIALVTTDSTHSRLSNAVENGLSKRFTVLHAPFAGAAATVLIGDRLPASTAALAGPVFAVLPERAVPSVRIIGVAAPARAPLHSRVPITSTLVVRSGGSRRLDVVLRMNGIVIDRVQRQLTADADLSVSLNFVPATTGPARLQLTAELDGSSESAASDLLVDVHEQRWSVLFYDTRPSWSSTFVRRAIERDPRFVVTSRVLTSRNISSDAGGPPESLEPYSATSLHDAIVIGAPEGLSEPDVAGLDRFMRQRGGTVILLFDQNADGPYRRLTRVAEWTVRNAVTTVVSNGERLRASTVMWPARLPAGARPLAQDSLRQPVLWQLAAGAGRAIVSGALDAWKFRDPSQSDFDRFWQTLVAQAAASAAPPVAIELTHPLLAPGRSTDVTVTIRDPASGNPPERSISRVSAAAAIDLPGGPVAIRLWPDGLGRFRGSLRAPATTGTYRVNASSDAGRTTAVLMVGQAFSQPVPDQRDLVTALASSRGGSAVSEHELEQLPDRIANVLQPATRRETWHPMRSAWWILPFVLFLGTEWWWRRRRGLS